MRAAAAPSLDDLARDVEKRKRAYDRCPEGSRDEPRLAADLDAARIRLLQAQLSVSVQAGTAAQAETRVLKRELARMRADQAAAKERLLREARDAAKAKPRRVRAPADTPLFDHPGD